MRIVFQRNLFDQGTVALGSTRVYKSANHIRVNSECDVEVPRESVYDAEMYRILVMAQEGSWFRGH